MPGPAPKLKVVKEREGNIGHQKIDPGVRLPPIAPAMPDWLAPFPTVTLGRKPGSKPMAPRRPRKDDSAEEKLVASRLLMVYLTELYAWRQETREYEARKRLKAEAERCRRTAKAAWEHVVPVLDAIGILATIDRSALADYCILVARVEQAERDITRNGIWVPGERGAQKNPATTFVNQAYTHLKTFRASFGLTPLDRDRLEPRGAGEGAGGLFD